MAFQFIEAFEINDAETSIKAKVAFDEADFSKPLDVFVTDTRTQQSVAIPFDLFERFIAGVKKAADQ